MGLPRTGQTSPAGPGDDGELRAGIPWPQPRFTARAELRSLLNYGAPKPYLWLRAQGIGIPKTGTAETYQYSTSTTSGLPDRAWMVDLGTGASSVGLQKGKLKRVWPVRGGAVLP